MKIMFAIITALALQGCAQYLELVRIGQSEQWQQEQRELRLRSLERRLDRELRKRQ